MSERPAFFAQVGPFVGAEDEDGLGFAAVDLGEVALELAVVVVVGERVGDAADVEQDADRGRRRGDGDDHHRGEGEAPPVALRLRRRLVVAAGRRLLRGRLDHRRLNRPSVGERAQEGAERLPVGLQRGDRDPLLGAVVPLPDRAELDRRHPHPQEGDRVGGAVATDAHRLAVVMGARRLAQGAHEGGVAVDRRRRAGEERRHLGAGQAAHLLQHPRGVLVGQVADVDVDHASVGHLVERVAAPDPAEIDRGAVEQLRAVPGKR